MSTPPTAPTRKGQRMTTSAVVAVSLAVAVAAAVAVAVAVAVANRSSGDEGVAITNLGDRRNTLVDLGVPKMFDPSTAQAEVRTHAPCDIAACPPEELYATISYTGPGGLDEAEVQAALGEHLSRHGYYQGDYDGDWLCEALQGIRTCNLARTDAEENSLMTTVEFQTNVTTVTFTKSSL